jgi:hypothetical protein
MINTIINAEPGSRQRLGVRLENQVPNPRTVVLVLYILSQIRVLMYLFNANTDFLRSHNKELKTLLGL